MIGRWPAVASGNDTLKNLWLRIWTIRWQQIKVLFDSAVELTPERRSSFLAEACGNDQSLRAEVDGLLMHCEQAEGFLEGSPGADLYDRIQSKTDEPAFSSGQIISGRFRIVELVGRGGMGEVYRARDISLKRDVAIKVLPVSYSLDPDRLHRFHLEAEAAAALNHPNILSIFHIGQQDGSPYIVTELLEGKPSELVFAAVACHCGSLAVAVEAPGWLQPIKGITRAISSRKISSSPRMTASRFDFGLANSTGHHRQTPKQLPSRFTSEPSRTGSGNGRLHVARTVRGTRLTHAATSLRQARSCTRC